VFVSGMATLFRDEFSLSERFGAGSGFRLFWCFVLIDVVICFRLPPTIALRTPG
jgi:hypothetical protein